MKGRKLYLLVVLLLLFIIIIFGFFVVVAKFRLSGEEKLFLRINLAAEKISVSVYLKFIYKSCIRKLINFVRWCM